MAHAVERLRPVLLQAARLHEAHCFEVMADALDALGRSQEAAGALQQALERFEWQGNRTNIERVGRKLARVSAG